ncbi:S41 family peptidase [Pedobacter sp. KR3-3]|uniref:S41 family peptidase n=1 Tax=Pedobacter albus TaxID=3113905 RepID=A0ABU7I503_9SPHI|nr:S41 family peptidase [Pedobacter sp. KR3-3]MEE1944534.1 S41 family peptidase [Pedobacter sp. KR3-3]
MKRILLTLLIILLTSGQFFGQTLKLTKTEKGQVINSLIEKLNDNYIFLDVAQKAAKNIKMLEKKGSYTQIDEPKNLAKLLTEQLREVVHDKHLNLWYNSNKPATQTSPQEQEASFMRQMKRVNLGLPKIDILEGNVGYLKIEGFGPVEKVGETCSGAMMFLANTDALIIDLRDNQGGEPDLVQYLASYFFDDKPILLNSLYYRKKNKTDEYWTVPVKGSKYTDKPVFILINNTTFSAGEELAYDLKTQHKALLVGETTGGGANDGEVFELGNGFFAFIPTGKAINPITHTNWEGTGVAPDVAVPATKALTTAHQMALKAVMEKMPEQEKPFYAKALANIKE